MYNVPEEFPEQVRWEIYGLVQQEQEPYAQHAYRRLAQLHSSVAVEHSLEIEAIETHQFRTKSYFKRATPGVAAMVIGVATDIPPVAWGGLFYTGAHMVKNLAYFTSWNKELSANTKARLEYLSGAIAEHPGRPKEQ